MKENKQKIFCAARHQPRKHVLHTVLMIDQYKY